MGSLVVLFLQRSWVAFVVALWVGVSSGEFVDLVWLVTYVRMFQLFLSCASLAFAGSAWFAMWI